LNNLPGPNKGIDLTFQRIEILGASPAIEAAISGRTGHLHFLQTDPTFVLPEAGAPLSLLWESYRHMDCNKSVSGLDQKSDMSVQVPRILSAEFALVGRSRVVHSSFAKTYGREISIPRICVMF
jgi:hypothetical protein